MPITMLQDNVTKNHNVTVKSITSIIGRVRGIVLVNIYYEM